MYDYMNDPNLIAEERDAFAEESLGALSRAERIAAIEKERGEARPKSARKYFDFNCDADDRKIYGIDVSHHAGDIDWSKVAGAGARFSYIKASQGVTLVDGRFRENIKGAIRSGIPAGAYHFLSSLTPADRQADTFIGEYGPWHAQCALPPVVDIEWDKRSADSRDRWERKTSQAIVAMAQTVLERIEREFGVRPLIYTNKSWWESRIGKAGNVLSDYPLWPSRYGGFDESAPPVMSGFNWVLWQFTEHGKIDGINTSVDVNWCKPGFV